MNILIAGGSGLIGSALAKQLREEGHEVKVLTRNPSKDGDVYWNPSKGEIDESALTETEVLIHLCGAGVADKNWTRKRKEELLRSRLEPIDFLFSKSVQMHNLKYSLSVSGINCYGIVPRETAYTESDAYGTGFIDQLVQQWETAALRFAVRVPVGVLRMGVVLSDEGGAVEKFTKPMRYGFGAVIGRGTQVISWIHIDDAVGVFAHAIHYLLEGKYNVLAGNASNAELTHALAAKVGSKIRLPRVPGFLMKLNFGEMSVLLLEGVEASNQKLLDSGFEFSHPTLKEAVESLKL